MAELIPIVNWRNKIPAGWTGTCTVCGEPMSGEDFDAQAAAAVVGPEGIVACHVRHITDPAEYERAVRTMAAAKAAQLKEHPS
jgi:hypothetical protein